jgi:hypothetical protein
VHWEDWEVALHLPNLLLALLHNNNNNNNSNSNKRQAMLLRSYFMPRSICSCSMLNSEWAVISWRWRLLLLLLLLLQWFITKRYKLSSNPLGIGSNNDDKAYRPLGRVGAAVLGTKAAKKYQVYMYYTKTKPICMTAITEHFAITV